MLLLLVPSQQKWEVVDEWPEVPTDANLDGWEVTGIEPVDVTTQVIKNPLKSYIIYIHNSFLYII